MPNCVCPCVCVPMYVCQCAHVCVLLCVCVCPCACAHVPVPVCVHTATHVQESTSGSQRTASRSLRLPFEVESLIFFCCSVYVCQASYPELLDNSSLSSSHLCGIAGTTHVSRTGILWAYQAGEAGRHTISPSPITHWTHSV